jgi:hypothetical protein
MFQPFGFVYFLHAMCWFGVKTMPRKLAVFLAAIVFFALPGIVHGQSRIEVGLGVRGGLLATPSFQANRLCVDTACGLSSSTFAANKLPGTFGPAVNVLFNDHIELRFEAVHRRFGYQVQSVVPAINQQSVGTTQGKLWEYPILATYHFSSGSVRPFAGGGFSVGVSGMRSTETVDTRPGFPTSVFRTSGPLLNGTNPFYLVAGVDGRISHISIRPEFRYGRFSGGDEMAEEILKPNQFEFLLGLSVQFGIKKIETHR